MTVATRNIVSSSLLYLAIDLGDRPTMSEYSRQTNALNVLWRHCMDISRARELPTPRGAKPPNIYPVADPSKVPHIQQVDLERQYPLLIRRTSVASPWLSVLTTLAERSAPIGYGLTAVFALQRLLNMLMGWQRHRINIRVTEQTLLSNQDLARLAAQEAHETQRAEGLLANHAMTELNEHQRPFGRGSDWNFESVVFRGEEVKEATASLAPVLEAKMIDEDDPRATGLAR